MRNVAVCGEVLLFVFFFSSRRRHTICYRDWSSDVCSSDLMARKSADRTTKYVLTEKDIPTRWYNIQADLKTPPAPVMHPGTGQPIGPQDLAPLFPMELIKQEVSQERWIEDRKRVV